MTGIHDIPHYTAAIVTAVVALGMGVVFYRADPDSPTSRALALALVATGVGIAADVLLAKEWGANPPAWGGITAIPEVIAFCAAFQWMLRVRRTIPAGGLRTRFGDNALRVAQALVVLYGVLALLFPAQRGAEFMGNLFELEKISGLGFWMFAAPLELAMLLGLISILLVLNRRPDRAEAQRLIAFCVAIPFVASGMVLPTGLASIATALGLVILLGGAVQYHVMQGQRGLFLARFLSPQVADLVSKRGLRSVMQDTSMELSVVCCDLRGFTAFAERTASEEVIGVLRNYYDAVGEIAMGFHGTIKDYAGDGILILVGAPLAVQDHAGEAVRMAAGIRNWARTQRSDQGHMPGIGIGVASGRVTVGIIGGAGRMEYAAVGPAVNLAARLCDVALPDEILVDERTVNLLSDGSGRVQPRAPLALKGVGEQVRSFALDAA